MKPVFLLCVSVLLLFTGCASLGAQPAKPAPTVTVTAPVPQGEMATPERVRTPSPAASPTSEASSAPTEKATSNTEETSDEPTQRTQKPRVYDSLFDGCPATIKKGQSGRCVMILQMRLNVYGFYVVEDGDFGSQTDKAVRSFQTSRGITVDGLVGTQTKTYLGG